MDEHDEQDTTAVGGGSPVATADGEVAHVGLAAGSRLLVFSGLGLRRNKSDAAIARSNELARRLESITAPCVVVLAGDTFDLEADAQVDPRPILATHQRLADAVAAIAGRADCSVVVIPGRRDRALATDRSAVDTVERLLGARVASVTEAHVTTGSGCHRLHIESGTRFEPFAQDGTTPAAATTARSGHDDPAHAAAVAGGWLDDLDLVADRAQRSDYVASRFFYRRAVGRFGWLALPLVASLGLLGVGRLLRPTRQSAAHAVDSWAAVLAIGSVALALAASVCAAIWWWTDRRSLQAVAGRAADEPGGDDRVGRSRVAAAGLIDEGRTGVITGCSRQAALTDFGKGFAANPGAWGPVAVRRVGRLGAPDAWAVEERSSWLDIEAGADLSVELHEQRRRLPTTTFWERVCTRSEDAGSGNAEVVAAWPDGSDWPVATDDGSDRRRARRLAAAAIAGAGLMNLVSAVLPPVRARVVAVREIVPLAVAQAAAAIVALVGLLLLLLARGVRRGQRHAWILAEIVLGVSCVLHVVKGLDVEEALLAGAVGAYLFAKRRHFRVRADEAAVGRGLAVLGLGALVAVGVAVAVIELGPGPRPSWSTAVQAAIERLVGITRTPVGGHLDQFLVPVSVAVSIGLVAYAGWLLFGPIVAHRLAPPEPTDLQRARGIVERSNGGSLAYFALRDDKRWFFWEHTLVAYAVSQGVALVSPDPIGPVVERRQAWSAFRRFADDHGWPIAVMGAASEWLPIYRESGMRDLYVGDEAVVDVRRFTLAGPRNKAIRQAFNRIANKGYTMTFEDPATVDPDLATELRALMGESRRGEIERGFSMTLGRVFDPRDAGLLLAVCRDDEGRPVAFCQFVPAPGIGGYSLDLMRRSEAREHPNGLTDFVIASTILHLHDAGFVGLALNFATMRGVLAGERGDGTQRRLERWISHRMSDSMQIESLWRYNAKFDPDWVPRYACYDAAEHLVAAASALAKAESWWEIPVIGRFFRPDEPVPVPAGAGLLK